MSKELELFLDEDEETLRTLSGFAHWISTIRGHTKTFTEMNYPGWLWNNLIPQL